jgi:integrase
MAARLRRSVFDDTSGHCRLTSRIVETLYASEWYLPILLAAITGMRRGEVLGLTWRNVDLDADRLTVSRQILSVEYEAKVADVKTSHSRRAVDLDPKQWRHARSTALRWRACAPTADGAAAHRPHQEHAADVLHLLLGPIYWTMVLGRGRTERQLAKWSERVVLDDLFGLESTQNS